MKVGKTNAFLPATLAAPGIAIVAVDENNHPSAIGVQLSVGPTRRSAELTGFTTQFLARSDRIGDVTTAISSALDIAADQHPAWSSAADDARGVLAFVSTGISLARAIDQSDKRDIAITGFKFGANAIDLLNKSGVLGTHPVLHTVVLIAKSSGAMLSAAVPKAKAFQ